MIHFRFVRSLPSIRFINYFSILELPVCYDIEISLIKEKVRKMQKYSHPDKGGSADQSAQINQAASILKSHHERGIHL